MRRDVSRERSLRPASPRRAGAGAVAALALACGASVTGGCRRERRPASPPPPVAAARQVVLPVPRAVSLSERAGFAGSQACIRCPVTERGQLASRHALTLTPAGAPQHQARFRTGARRTDPATGIEYTVGLAAGRGRLVARQGRRARSVTAEYGFGSGNRGVTYLGRDGDRTLELRLSYYAPLRGWDFSPNQPPGARTGAPGGRPVAPSEEAQCFLCHSTALVAGADRPHPERSILGIGCEGCHGPGRTHIAAIERGDRDPRMARLATEPQRVSLEICGTCHSPSTSDDLADPAVSGQLARFQSLALAQSACFRKSRLSCMTCHDPHRDAVTGGTTYNAICGSCHSAATPGQVACKVPRAVDCVKCHMPAQALDIPTRPIYRNHWIGVWTGKAL